MAEQTKAGNQGAITTAPVSVMVQAITAGSETDIEDNEMKVMNEAFDGATPSVPTVVEEPPASAPELTRLVSMDSVVQMKRKYKRNTRLLALLAITFPASLLGYICFSADTSATGATTSLDIVALLVWLATVAVLLTMFINHKIRFRSQSNFQVYLNELIFGKQTANEHDIFEMNERQYAGLWLYCALLYHALFCLFRLIWKMSDAPELLWAATPYIHPIAVNLVLLLFMYSVTDQCAVSIDQQRNQLVQRYSKFELEKMDSHVMDELKSGMIQNQRFRPWRFALIYVVFLLSTLVSPIFDWGIYSGGQYLIQIEAINTLRDDPSGDTMAAKVLMWVVWMIDAVPWTVLI